MTLFPNKGLDTTTVIQLQATIFIQSQLWKTLNNERKKIKEQFLFTSKQVIGNRDFQTKTEGDRKQ